MDHGVARFEGLRRMTFGTLEGEFLCLIFRDGDQLYLPVDRLSSVSKYADRDRTNVHLDKLGSGHWEKVKAKAKRTAKDYAAQLIELYARRKKAHAMALPSVAEQDEQFEAEFPFEETRDQEHAIIAVHRDLSSDTPSDRLICGDVGFGKTEVAMRAAFRVASRGHQVAVTSLPSTRNDVSKPLQELPSAH
jgi:transcription-repair coupling factor (superfamily II helicase)